ncbi:hypothetical protein V1478_012222 [Vespula squamosa]|uniref:Secreted protein n=1 Tax=Vespula squamosa TaxID=30214 RepID=A0ABD2ACL7_VESSQ
MTNGACWAFMLHFLRFSTFLLIVLLRLDSSFKLPYLTFRISNLSSDYKIHMYFPVDPHMQRPPRGGIWVGITCDISKSNCKLFNFLYSDNIILHNTMQIKYYIFNFAYVHSQIRTFQN